MIPLARLAMKELSIIEQGQEQANLKVSFQITHMRSPEQERWILIEISVCK